MSVLNKVTHYKKKIERYKEHTETLIHCINKLHQLPITVQHLEKTGIGKTINELRKFDGDVGNIATALVWKWKREVFIEMVAEEQAEKERDLKNPSVKNSDENVLNAVKTEEEEEPTHTKDDINALSSTAGNDGTEMLQEIYQQGHISSIENLNCNDSEHESHRCDTLHEFTEGLNSPVENISSVLAINQSSPKTEKQKDSHHHHHRHSSRREKPKHNKEGNEVDSSEFRIKVDGIKIKLEKVHTRYENNKQEENKSISSGLSSNHKHCSKPTENETKYLESKHCHEERGLKRKTGLNERSYTENIPKQTKSSQKVKKKVTYNDSIDYFAEALRMGDAMGNKKSSSTTTSMMRNSDSKISPDTKTTSIPLNSIRDIAPTKQDLWLADVKLEPLDVEVDLASMLSEISPNYKPLPHVPLTNEVPGLKQATKEIPLSKQHRQRMKVYCGVKTGRSIPTLYDLCVHVLKEHIDALEYTGGVPYSILKPILQQATPEQLFQVEYYNSYLIEDTNELWEFHCRKEFRSGQLQPMETAREMYLRCLNERETKLKALTCNIQQSLAKSSSVRQMKLAYVDSDPKPPRNVAREHATYGTGSIPKSNGGKSRKSAPVLKPLPSKATFNFFKKSTRAAVRAKPRLAPLMEKTMKLAKSFKK